MPSIVVICFCYLSSGLLSESLGLTLNSPLSSFLSSNVSSPVLSDLIQYRFNSSIEFVPFPPRPVCEQLLDTHDEQFAVSISTWKIDLSDTSIQGVLIWREMVSTTCTFTFWGSKSTSVRNTRIVQFTQIPEISELTRFLTNTIDETVEYPTVNDDDRYACYWCRNDYPQDYARDLYKHVIISRYPDGSIRTPQGAWVHMTGDFYTDGKRYLYISPDFKNSKTCPFLVHEVRFGVMSFSTVETIILSIPSIKQQYSITRDSDHLECRFHDTM